MYNTLNARKLLFFINIATLTIVFHPLLSIKSPSQVIVEAKYHTYTPTDVYDKNIKLTLLNSNNDDVDKEFDDFIKRFDKTSAYNLLDEELKNGNTSTSTLWNNATSILNFATNFDIISLIFQIITAVFMFHLLFTDSLGHETFAAVTSLIASCIFSSFFLDLISYEIVFVIQYISFAILWVLMINSDAKCNRMYAIFSSCSLIGAVFYNIISSAPFFPNSTGPVGLVLLSVGLDPIQHIIILRLLYLAVLYLLSASIYLKLPSVIVSGPSESEEIEQSEKQTTFLISIVCCWTLSSAIGKSATFFFHGDNPISPDNTFLTPSLAGFNVTTIVSLSIWLFTNLIMWEGYGVWYGKKDMVVERNIPPGFITEKWRVYSSSS
ncbi:hypothetical protein BMR1_01G01825 [Babesia microti strain RI]|uniref:Uncharacterized protein n=1 Tax=Babesia microti (strain RI) TaxID=1133968 RepID=A0A1N6LWS9_BABMR|nr:hypothetical protein BMR1_01G01825 [Babesia microti strain RI]SIO73323.1 hypothetical protein BMR1_01G01825 [Babesia microti strain RI]|eukprot:XP_021337425.1 hypothetical protein BMR1_01G01825 [Babesia microti strain RI]